MRRWVGVSDRLFASVLLGVLLPFPFAATAQTRPILLGDLDADSRPTVIDLQRLIGQLNGNNYEFKDHRNSVVARDA